MKDWFKKLKGAFGTSAARPIFVTPQLDLAFIPPIEAAPSASDAPAAAAVVSEPPNDGSAEVDEANRLSQAGQLEVALAVLESVAPGTAQWGMAQHRRATILRRLSRLEDAIAASSAAANTDGAKVEFIALLGNLLVQAGRLQEAEIALRRACELCSDDGWTYLNLGYLLHGKGRDDEAVQAMRQGLVVRPDDASLVAHLGRFLYAAGHLEESDAVLEKAANVHATTPMVHVFRSWVLRARGDYPSAIASLRRAIELDGSKPEWHAQLSMLERAETQQGEAGGSKPVGATANEAVRLVIWDLDDTFWRGTVTEGGIREYVQAHHDAVIELARRGIMSSICSKNDPATIARILEDHGIAEYFVFPSVSWEPKGPRIAALIEAVQLRPSTVMFIDDNHLNRAEAARMVPGLQVEDEHFIAKLLDDPRFKGKDDSKLTRLTQYKLLERRKADEGQALADGSNESFLRGCDIRVHIDYDVMANLDRAIELINRTHQLNFTKRRLPEDEERARAVLAAEISPSYRQAGLVRVTDRYGDYGYVGFFVTQITTLSAVEGQRDTKLLHFCFSCRTLGMLVEKWLYDHLGRPQLTVVGEVLTDLTQERAIDWITLGTASVDGTETQNALAPEVRFLGGCETNALGFYLNARTPKVVIRGNFAANGLFFRLNSVSLILSYTERMAGGAFEEESLRLGMPKHLGAFDLFGNAPQGTLLVVNCRKDSFGGIQQYRHRKKGWAVVVEIPSRPHLNLLTTPSEALDREVQDLFPDPEENQSVRAVVEHLRKEYVYQDEPFTLDQIESGVREIIERVNPGSKLVFTLDHHVARDPNGRLRELPALARANERIRAIAAEFPFVGTVSFGDSIANDEEIQQGGNHYDRRVYCRVAEDLAKQAAQLLPRPPATASMMSAVA